MASKAHAVLFDIVAKLRAILAAESKVGHTGSFEDINAFVAFRKASGVERGVPIDAVAFRKALTTLGITHSKKLASVAFGILLSMDGNAQTNPDNNLQFRHFHAVPCFSSYGTFHASLRNQNLQ